MDDRRHLYHAIDAIGFDGPVGGVRPMLGPLPPGFIPISRVPADAYPELAEVVGTDHGFISLPDFTPGRYRRPATFWEKVDFVLHGTVPFQLPARDAHGQA